MAETIVKIENLVKRYHELVAVDHFNLTVSKGEILGLLGPNGSGKTTTMNCLLSLLAYDKGSIEVFGKPMISSLFRQLDAQQYVPHLRVRRMVLFCLYGW